VTGVPAVIPVYFDFASTLCYAAHRVMSRLAGDLTAAGIALDWRPIDLARITGWKRGVDAVGGRRAHVLQVARELAGSVRMPPRWIDSRPASAVALVIFLSAASARAEEPAKDPTPVPGGWTFELTPYVWFASLDGNAGPSPSGSSVQMKNDAPRGSWRLTR